MSGSALDLTSSKSFLYVEDDENDALLMKHICGRTGLSSRLHVVTNGAEAMDYLRGVGPYGNRQAHPLPALLLLDWKLPGTSGLEVLRWVRAQAASRTLPVVVFTSSGQETDIQAAYAAGADAYIVKPCTLERLRQIIDGVKEFLSSPAPHLALLPGIEPKRPRPQAPTLVHARA